MSIPLLGAGLAQAGGSNFPPALTANLVAYWKLDETSGTRVDSKSNSDFTETGTVPSEAGIIANGVTGDETETNELILTNGSNLTAGANEDFAFWFWLKVNSIPASNKKIFEFRAAGGGNEGIDFIIASADALSISWYNTTYIPCSWGAYSSTQPLGQWHLICCNFDRSGNMSIHHNGSTQRATGDISSQTSSIAQSGNQFTNFDGAVDEFGWSVGAVLSNDDMDALYNNGNGVTYP